MVFLQALQARRLRKKLELGFEFRSRLFTLFPGCPVQTSADRESRERQTFSKTRKRVIKRKMDVKRLTTAKVHTFLKTLICFLPHFSHADVAKTIFEIRSIGSKNGRVRALPGLPDRSSRQRLI